MVGEGFNPRSRLAVNAIARRLSETPVLKDRATISRHSVTDFAKSQLL